MASQQASEKQFQEWEALVEKGVPPFEASRMVGTTLRRLENGDAVRKQRIMELAKERQAALVEQRTEAIVAQADPPQGIFQAWQKANHEGYQDKTKVEISGPEGGPIQLEGRAVVGLADVARYARSIGFGHLLGLDAGDAGNALPAAEEVRADPAGGERPAGVLPPARSA